MHNGTTGLIYYFSCLFTELCFLMYFLYYCTMFSFIMSRHNQPSFFLLFLYNSIQLDKWIQKTWWLVPPCAYVRVHLMLEFHLSEWKNNLFHGLPWFFFFLISFDCRSQWSSFSPLCLCGLCFPELKMSHITTGWQKKAALMPSWLMLSWCVLKGMTSYSAGIGCYNALL